MDPSPDFPRTLAQGARTGGALPGGGDSVEPQTPDPAIEDAATVAAVLAGDREKFRKLIERYERKVFNLAFRYLRRDRERATDAAQEIFLKLYRGLGSFRTDARFSTWLHRVAVNHLISEIRKDRAQKRGRALSLDAPLFNKKGDDFHREVGDRSGEPVGRLTNEEKGRRVLEAIEGLEDELRMVVLLCDVQGQSYEDAAQAMGTPIGTVRSRLHRAREILKQRLKGLS